MRSALSLVFSKLRFGIVQVPFNVASPVFLKNDLTMFRYCSVDINPGKHSLKLILQDYYI